MFCSVHVEIEEILYVCSLLEDCVWFSEGVYTLHARFRNSSINLVKWQDCDSNLQEQAIARMALLPA